MRDENHPKFRITMREGRAALWVDGMNIADIPPDEATPSVLRAVMNAYKMGDDAARRSVRNFAEKLWWPIRMAWERDGEE